MTQLRKFRDSISNYFDDLLRGIGKRDSSFMDMDAVSHDRDSGRFLFMEFKQPGESLHPATRMVLSDLAGLPRCTVWFIRRLGDGRIGFGEFRSGRREENISEFEFQERYRRWWFPDRPPASLPKTSGLLTATEIRWSS